MRTSLCILVSVLTLSSPSMGQRSAVAESLLTKGLHAAMRHAYADAHEAFAKAALQEPHDPAPLVMLAGLRHEASEDLSAPFDRRTFDSLLTRAEVLATSGPLAGTPDGRMWHSTARGMLSVVESREGHWMSAVRDALASASAAREAMAQDPSGVDAGLPLGNFFYWRSRTTEAINWLPFIADDRDEGIRLLERCAQEGRYHRWTAISSLIWILHDAGSFDRAEQWARVGLASYPDNRTFLAGLAKVLEARGQHRDAAAAWAKVASGLRRDPSVGRYAVFSAGVNEARCLLQAGDAAAASSVLSMVRPPRPEEVPEWIGSRLSAKAKEWERLREASASSARVSDEGR